MTCTYCNTPLPQNARYCTGCGRDLADQEKLTELDKRIIRAHSQEEFKRNTKGLYGFGCLTLHVVMGVMVVLSEVERGQFGEIVPGILILGTLGFSGHGAL